MRDASQDFLNRNIVRNAIRPGCCAGSLQMLSLLIPTNVAIQKISPRRNAALPESWWEKQQQEKENVILAARSNNNMHSNTKTIEIVKMEMSNDDIPSLRGWFIKEKRDVHKKRPTILPGTSNRRWFTIERIPNNNNENQDPSEELALCYYKRSSPDKETRSGWLFLNDVLSLSQDIPNRWMTIEHPTRIMRLQSPTPAQHRVWFSTLSKCCKSMRKDVTFSSSTTMAYFSEDSVRKAKEKSLKLVDDPVASTVKDELDFLREITGQTSESCKNLFTGPSFSSHCVEDVAHVKENVPVRNKPEFSSKMRNDRSNEGEAVMPTAASPSALGGRLGSAIESEDKKEIEPYDSLPARRYRNNDQFDLKEMRTDLTFSHKNIPASDSRTSSSSTVPNQNDPATQQIRRSSSYRLHFGDDEDSEIEADDDFCDDDWDA